MTLFLDTSVVLAASGSENGASREVFRLAPLNHWRLVATPYVIEEVMRNLPRLPPSASYEWPGLRRSIELVDDILTINLPVVFPVPSDRPILFSALPWADVLLTHNRNDFDRLLGTEFYGLQVLSPGSFLEQQRAAGQLKVK